MKRKVHLRPGIWLGLLIAALAFFLITAPADLQTTESVAATQVSSSASVAEATVTTAIVADLSVHFLDVGQGHATVFQQDTHALIIDGGARDSSSFVVAYLKKIGVQSIDAVIATHYDSDHIYGLVGVLNAFPVAAVYDADYSADTKVFTSFKTAVQAEKCPEYNPEPGDTVEFPEMGGLSATFVGPRDYYYDEENDNSLAIRLDNGISRFLILGDTSADAEQDMLQQDLRADVMLASHHGSNGSNSTDLLSAVQPEALVISCGIDNPYGHPGEYALLRIQHSGADLFRTDLQGLLICHSDGQTLKWSQTPINDFTPGS